MKNHNKDWGRYQRVSRELERKFGDPTLPSYRFYGVKRRVYPRLEKICKWVARIFFCILMSTFACIVVATAVAFFLYFPELWLRLLVGILLALLLFLALTKNFRRRRKCRRKLIKTCKKTGATVSFRKGFLRTYFWNGEREDFCIKTNWGVYYGHYLGVKKYGTKLYLDAKGEIRLNHSPIRSMFTVMFDVKSTHVCRPIRTDLPEHVGMKTHRVLLVNPRCDSIWYKKWEGGYESTGDGGEHFGLTIYSVHGLCEAIKRETEQKYRSNI